MHKLILTLCTATLAMMYGCAPKAVVKPDSMDTMPSSSLKSPAPKEGSMEVTDGAQLDAKASGADTIYFPLDSFSLEDRARTELDRLADSLTSNPASTVTISGHTCELGTSEYNLALGQQRARVARDYLVRLGVKADQVNVISYGEEHPAASGTGDDVWAKNRRDEFTISAKASQTQPTP